MSWSANAIGTPAAVARAIRSQIEAATYIEEPEKTTAMKVAETIDAAVVGYDPGVAIRVTANGSMWLDKSVDPPVVKGHTVVLNMEALGQLAT